MTAPPTRTTTPSPFPTSPTGVTTRSPVTTTARPATTTRYDDPVSQEHLESGGLDQPSGYRPKQHTGVRLDFSQSEANTLRQARNRRSIQGELRDVLTELDEASLDVSDRSANLAVLEDYKARHGGSIPAPVEHITLTDEQKADAYRRYGGYTYGDPTEPEPPPSVTDTTGRRGQGNRGGQHNRRRGSAKGQTYFSEEAKEFALEAGRTLRDSLVSPFGSLKKYKEAEQLYGAEYSEKDIAADTLHKIISVLEFGGGPKTPTYEPEAGAEALREALLETQKRLAINKRIQDDPSVQTRLDVEPITKEEVEAQEDAALETWGLHPSQHEPKESLLPEEDYDRDATIDSIKEAAAPFIQQFYKDQPGLLRRAVELVPIVGTVAYGIGPGGRPIGQTLARAALFDLPSVLALGRIPAIRRTGSGLLETAAEVGLDVYAFNPRDFGQIVGGSGRDFTRAVASEAGGPLRTLGGINPFSDHYLGSSIATSGGTNKIDVIDLQRKFGLDEAEANRISQELKEKIAAANTEVGAGVIRVEAVTDSGDVVEASVYATLPGSHTTPTGGVFKATDGDPIGSSAAQPFVVDVQKAIEEAVKTRTEVRQLADQTDAARARLAEHLDDLRPLQEEQARLNKEHATSGAWKDSDSPVVEGLPEKTDEALAAVTDLARAQGELEEAALLGEYLRLTEGEEGAFFLGSGGHENYYRSSALGLGGGGSGLEVAEGAVGTWGLRPGFNPTLNAVLDAKGRAAVLIGPRAAGEDFETVIGDPTVRVPYKTTREIEHIQRTSPLNVEGGGGKVNKSLIEDPSAPSPFGLKKGHVVGTTHGRGVDVDILGVEPLTTGQRLQLKFGGIGRGFEAFVNPGQYTSVKVRKIGNLPGGRRRGGPGGKPDDPGGGPGGKPDDPGGGPGGKPDDPRRSWWEARRPRRRSWWEARRPRRPWWEARRPRRRSWWEARRPRRRAWWEARRPRRRAWWEARRPRIRGPEWDGRDEGGWS